MLLSLMAGVTLPASALSRLVAALLAPPFTRRLFASSIARRFFAPGPLAFLSMRSWLWRVGGLGLSAVDGADLRIARWALPAIATASIAPLVA